MFDVSLVLGVTTAELGLHVNLAGVNPNVLPDATCLVFESCALLYQSPLTTAPPGTMDYEDVLIIPTAQHYSKLHDQLKFRKSAHVPSIHTYQSPDFVCE